VTEKDFYRNPFSGRKTPLQMGGLFLFSPSVDMKLTGHPMRQLFAEMGQESLYKRVQQLNPLDDQAAEQLMQKLVEICPTAALAPVMAAVSRGDAAAQAAFADMGTWEVALYDQVHGSAGPLTAHNRFILEIERACEAPFASARQHHMAEAVALLAEHPLMRNFLWPEATAALLAAANLEALLPMRASVALEIRLSLIAIADVTLDEVAQNDASHFTNLLPSAENPTRNPTALFFAWMKRAAGATTIEAMLSNPSPGRRCADITTLKRWSSGSHHPRVEWLRLFSKELFGDPDYKPLWSRYWAATYLNFIGYLAETCRREALARPCLPQAAAWSPWPRLPFNNSTIASWLATRYPLWLDFHRARLAVADAAGNPTTAHCNQVRPRG
jgi:hypothetical protein